MPRPRNLFKAINFLGLRTGRGEIEYVKPLRITKAYDGGYVAIKISSDTAASLRKAALALGVSDEQALREMLSAFHEQFSDGCDQSKIINALEVRQRCNALIQLFLKGKQLTANQKSFLLENLGINLYGYKTVKSMNSDEIEALRSRF